MARVSGFILLVVLLFLVESERSSSLPTRIQSNDFEEDKGGLNQNEREHIRQILMLAAKELRDKDIIQVLKKSLILRLKICLSSPLPSLPPEVEILPTEGYGERRDEGVSTEPQHRLRTVLKEALERIDEEEILDFLKSSLYFRLVFCLHTPFVKGPFPEPGPSPGGHASKPTPSQGPDGTVMPRTSKPNIKPNMVSPSSSPTEPLNETKTTTITGENPPKEEKEITENDTPDLPEVALKNTITSISRRNEIPHADDFPRDEMTRDGSQFSVNGHDSAVQSAELQGLKKRRGPVKASSMESISDNGDITKPSESLLNGKESTAIEESDEGNAGLIDTASDDVGKAALRAERQSMEILTTNSDEGEFQSVIRIDYDALADEEKKTGTRGVDLGPLVEPNEQLSL